MRDFKCLNISFKKRVIVKNKFFNFPSKFYISFASLMLHVVSGFDYFEIVLKILLEESISFDFIFFNKTFLSLNSYRFSFFFSQDKAIKYFRKFITGLLFFFFFQKQLFFRNIAKFMRGN